MLKHSGWGLCDAEGWDGWGGSVTINEERTIAEAELGLVSDQEGPLSGLATRVSGALA